MSMASRIIIAIVLVLLFGALWAWLAPAKAQQPSMCFPSAEVMRRLAERFGEAQIATGTAGTAAMRLYVDKADGSWTMLVFPRPDVACIPAGGEDFTIDEETLKQGPEL